MFASPIRIGRPGAWETITPTAEWKSTTNKWGPSGPDAATDLFYVNVARQ